MLTDEHRTNTLDRLNAIAPGGGGAAPAAVHVVAGGWIIAMLLFARFAPDRYAAAMQEDRAIEWATSLLFAAAGVVRLRSALRGRRGFDVLVGLFCLFVAGEEISWGQRLLGIVPPAAFLAQNTQQELNLHNFADVFGKPKWMLVLALAGYGLLLPVVARTRRWQWVARRLGATSPPLASSPLFLACIALLVWYPVEFTGEWVECLAAMLFLATAGLTAPRFWGMCVALATLAFGLTVYSGRGTADDASRVACARTEVDALVADMMSGAAPGLDRGGTIHKRVWTAAGEGHVDLDRLTLYRSTPCPGSPGNDATARRRYAVDPWGTAYWIKTVRAGGNARRVLVYSFGPNRRRDGDAADAGPSRGDDVVTAAAVQSP